MSYCTICHAIDEHDDEQHVFPSKVHYWWGDETVLNAHCCKTTVVDTIDGPVTIKGDNILLFADKGDGARSWCIMVNDEYTVNVTYCPWCGINLDTIRDIT